MELTLTPCILPENLCGTFWQQESPAARSLGLLMSRPAKYPGRSCPTPSNRDEMNWEREISLSLCPSGEGSSFLKTPVLNRGGQILSELFRVSCVHLWYILSSFCFTLVCPLCFPYTIIIMKSTKPPVQSGRYLFATKTKYFSFFLYIICSLFFRCSFMPETVAKNNNYLREKKSDQYLNVQLSKIIKQGLLNTHFIVILLWSSDLKREDAT